MALEVKNLTFSYGSLRVLHGLEFSVEPGEVVGLLGQNGAGKTTLIKVLACLLARDTGYVAMDGIDPEALPVRYRSNLGYLSEACPLYGEMSVRSYLAYRALLKGERGSRVRVRVREAIASCGLEDAADARINSLSKGMRKRVGLADATLRRPKLLLLDDPLASLDAASRLRVGEVVAAAATRAVVVVSGHEPQEMSHWCTRFITLKDRRIVSDVPNSPLKIN